MLDTGTAGGRTKKSEKLTRGGDSAIDVGQNW